MSGDIAKSGWEDSNLRPLPSEDSVLATAPHPVERERKESNLHLAVLETAAFPFKLLAHIVDRTGVEPVFAGCKPTVVPLDQRPVGGRGGTRTHNHQLTVDNQFLPARPSGKIVESTIALPVELHLRCEWRVHQAARVGIEPTTVSLTVSRATAAPPRNKQPGHHAAAWLSTTGTTCYPHNRLSGPDRVRTGDLRRDKPVRTPDSSTRPWRLTTKWLPTDFLLLFSGLCDW